MQSNAPSFEFNVEIRGPNSKAPPLVSWSELSIERGKIYTLEGPNQSGKSTAIGAITGVFPDWPSRPAPSVRVEISTRIDGNVVKIRNVAEAQRMGIVTVFQDDEMLPTMTVREQILLRHAARGLRGAIALLRSMALIKGKKYAGAMMPSRTGWAEALVDRVLPGGGTKSIGDVNAQAEALTKRFGDAYSSMLDKKPTELSGGARAVAKIVSALLHENIGLLILDEAFRGVQREVWPLAVDVLRDMSKERKFAILCVSHNHQEIIRWQPAVRYFVEDGKITSDKGSYIAIVSAIPPSNRQYKIFQRGAGVDDRGRWLDSLEEQVLVVVDKNVSEVTPTREILAQIEARFSRNQKHVVDLSEKDKTIEGFVNLIEKIGPAIASQVGGIVIIGGGVTLNLMGFVAGTLSRGVLPICLVPTTVMALSDVAVGSKTGVNFVSTRGGASSVLGRKHLFGTYTNPASVVFDRRYIETLPPFEIRQGLVECLKHGICQSNALFWRALRLSEIETLEGAALRDEIFDTAKDVAILKAAILEIDPFEKGIGRILQFGHLHAHALEQVSGFSIPHGSAVLWGVILDLEINRNLLSGAEREAMADVIGKLTLLGLRQFSFHSPELAASISDREKMMTSYHATAKREVQLPGSRFRIMRLSGIGQYSSCGDVECIEIGEDEVWSAIQIVFGKLKKVEA